MVALIRDMNQTHPPSTRRKAIHGGSTPASMRVMVVDGVSDSCLWQLTGQQ